MKPMRNSLTFGAAFSFVVGATSAAAAPTKEQCLDAHSRGQDQREAGHLSLARDSFSVCSQPSCPALVQSDCAAFTEELERLSPSVSFAARDELANDLPDTQVYIDGVLTAERLDEGRSYDVDPGRHTVRFIHGDRAVALNVVINQGEHGRNLIATFARPSAQHAAATETEKPQDVRDLRPEGRGPKPERAREQPPRRPVLPLIVAIGGGVAIATGGALMGIGFGRIPGNCSLSTHECTSPPGDPVFSDAHGGVSLVNVGLTTAIAGAVFGIGGLVWYLAESPGSEHRPAAQRRFIGAGFVF